jgi:hypothetical protein
LNDSNTTHEKSSVREEEQLTHCIIVSGRSIAVVRHGLMENYVTGKHLLRKHQSLKRHNLPAATPHEEKEEWQCSAMD